MKRLAIPVGNTGLLKRRHFPHYFGGGFSHNNLRGILKGSEYSDFDLKDCFEEGRRRMSDGCDAEAIQAFDLAIDNNIEPAQAYFNRGVCHYRLGNYRQAKDDLEAAALLGCKDALFWSKYETKKPASF
jgi:tetratricopeptide (TPR) repeat protein